MVRKFDPLRHYQIGERPLDAVGAELCPLDLVIIRKVPEHYYADPEFASLEDYKGRFGLVTYSAAGKATEPYYAGRHEHPGWVDGTLSHVNVLSRRISVDEIYSYEFWVPVADLLRIPYNSLIMNIFADYPWEMLEEDGPSSHPFLVRGMPQFAHIEMVMTRPYEDLVAAHDAAIGILSQ